MNFEPVDPFERLEEFRRLSNEKLDELLAELQSTEQINEPISFQPDVDLVETPSEFRIYLSVPGLIEDDIIIQLDGEHLTIRGERRPPYDVERRGTSLREWRYGLFERHFVLPNRIQDSNVRASYDAGVLTIVAQKFGVQP